jgi:hypothetical protein
MSGVSEALYSAGDEDAWCADISCLSLTALCGGPDFGGVGIVNRQRIVDERDAGDVGIRQCSSLLASRRAARCTTRPQRAE